MDENKTAKGLLLGFVTGSVVGAAIALLYAPKSGKELRNDIKLRKDDLLDDTSEFLQIAKSKAGDLINEGRRKSEELISDARKKAGTLIDDANVILNDAKEKATTTIDSTKEKLVSGTDKIKDALKAGVDAYNQEKSKNS
ncbi:MAG TPA: YtxH domain-containing protein [Ignavibacteria bacterium]|nr:YtxH domain-containing protein [Ignavibacteria bacterium]